MLHLIYHDRWCPYCNEFKCQNLLRSIAEITFNVNFSIEVALKKAFVLREEIAKRKINYKGIDYFFKIHVNKLRFDIYNGAIKINMHNGKEKKVKIALEYDGIQHDRFPNFFHRNEKQFCLQIARDRVKKEFATKYNTILIKIKEIDGFNFEFLKRNFNAVRKEILYQFNEQADKIRESLL